VATPLPHGLVPSVQFDIHTGMGDGLLDIAVHLVLILGFFLDVEEERRKDYFLFYFHLDSIILKSDAQQTLPLCEWSSEQCVLFVLIQGIKIGLPQKRT